MLNKIKEMLRHNQFLTTAAVIVVVLGVWLMGCESQVKSPFNPDRDVTRQQLQNEVDKYIVDIELAFVDLDRQDLFKQKLFEIGVVAAQGGTINPVGAGITLLGILGVGAVADNRKKDSVIRTMKSERKVVS
ncbi:hypothetical protein LCGC14_0684490 [marine sediment metagenome]|uniref:Uncharacterized protein n=1 Tax=marine sediment metagenome TaxID=412755 RepID=A0A0F9T8L5_9ZZZZ